MHQDWCSKIAAWRLGMKKFPGAQQKSTSKYPSIRKNTRCVYFFVLHRLHMAIEDIISIETQSIVKATTAAKRAKQIGKILRVGCAAK